MTQGAHFFTVVVFGEPVFRLLVGHLEMLRQARDIALADLDQVIAAAIARAFQAVVMDAGFGPCRVLHF